MRPFKIKIEKIALRRDLCYNNGGFAVMQGDGASVKRH